MNIVNVHNIQSKNVCVMSITVISSHPECRNARNVERSARRSELGAQARGGVHTGTGHDIENPGTKIPGPGQPDTAGSDDTMMTNDG